MPVLEEEVTCNDGYPLTIHSLQQNGGNGETSTTIMIKKESTVGEIIGTVLENFAIKGKSENFDLCEVFNDYGDFVTDKGVLLDNARILSFSEQPLIVSESWLKNSDSIDIPDQLTPNENIKEVTNGSFFSKPSNEKYRLYLSQKIESILSSSNVKVTWLDGLYSNMPPEEWHFDPFYREVNEIDDLVNLPVLTEKILLDELYKRFRRGRIYTYVGGILISVNPFKYFPIYNPKYIDAYQHRKLGELPPHVFAIADAAYLQMLHHKKDQCIVISGESGSGKTESTKLILHHLTALSHKTKASLLEKTILAAGPVLEAFGNAKTCHNDNSSRFGKFTQIDYRADGVVCGAVLKKYLLEKSRIVSQSKNERNYHVFYQLLAGATSAEKEEFNLGKPDDYFYLNQSGCYNIDGVDEAHEFQKLRHAIKNIGLHGGKQHRMFAVLSAVLLIGNIVFKKNTLDDTVTVDDARAIDDIAKLLQVEKNELIDPMTSRRTITRGEEFVRNYKKDEAIATRDAMAKCLYVSLFDWIVLQTNHIMINRHGRKPDKKAFSIGVLDIFGFENFQTNSFEQFCINLANENLQYYLNQHIFKMRQDEYIKEGLKWENVNYVDNSNCLNLIVGKPIGLIWLLDEECSLTMGTDKSLLEKFNSNHHANSCYEMPPTREPVFSVVHYAGHVKYQIKDFRTKNRDLMRNDIVMAFRHSLMLFMRELMGSDPVALYHWSKLRHVITAITIFKLAGKARAKGQTIFEYRKLSSWSCAMTPPNRRKVFLKRMTENEPEPETEALIKKATKVMNRRVTNISRMIQAPSNIRCGLEVKRTISGGMTEVTRRGGFKQPPTVVAQFQSSLLELMETLNKSHPFFVRCVRSNAQKEPLEFDAKLVLRQLRYTGMMETVKIRQAGYASRILIKDFMSQFKLLFPSKPKGSPSKDELTEFLKKIGLNESQFQIGETKVFMRESQYRLLRNELQKKIDLTAKKIQRWARSTLKRKHFLRMRESAIEIQKIYRGYICRRKLQKEIQRKEAAVTIKRFWRQLKIPKAEHSSYFQDSFKHSIVLIQARWRGYVARKRFKKMLELKREEDENKKILEDAENIMKNVFQDTIFNDEDRQALLNLSSSTDGLDEIDKEGEKKQATPVYEEINDFYTIFSKSQSEGGDNTNTSTPLVKLRTNSSVSSGNDNDRNASNFKQKLIRRLSFTAKDKRSHFHLTIKKSKEAEDFGFEIIAPDEDILKGEKMESLLPEILLNQPLDHKPTAQQEQQQSKSTIVDFFNSLNRRGSKKYTSKPEKKPISSTKPINENDYVIKGDTELEVFKHFLMQKVKVMSKPYLADCKNESNINKNEKQMNKKDGEVEGVFRRSLEKFHTTLIFNYGMQVQQEIKYIDLVNGFQEDLNQIVNQDEKVSKEFSIMGTNLFRGIIEEYEKNRDKLIAKWKTKVRRKNKAAKKKNNFIDHNGHCYFKQTCYITTYCEICNAIIHDGFGLKCRTCHHTCHKKCYSKDNKHCKGRRPSVCGPAGLFGTDLSQLTSPNNPIPLTIVKLIQEIEKRGLYTVGLYRKPGLQAAVNNLKSVLTSKESDEIMLEDERPYTLASVLKLFFRQLPKPVVPYEYYEELLRCADLDSETDMHSTIYELVQRFQTENKHLFERMIVHLARVANNVETNKMSPNGLAIIWAPCFLRPRQENDPLETLQLLPKQTKCIEVLIEIQLRTRRGLLKDITVLEEATSTAEKKLDNLIKAHSIGKQESNTMDATDPSSSISMTPDMDVIAIEIDNMEEERCRLTNGLSNMEPMKTRSLDSIDDLGSETDNEFLQGSFEDIIIRASPSQQSLLSTTSELNQKFPIIVKKNRKSDFIRKKFAEGTESSFEDITSEFEQTLSGN